MSERRAAFVTGGAQGLGAAIALGLARDGFDVVVSELSLQPLMDIVRAIEALGRRAHPVVLDLREQAMTSAVETFGRLDVMVNNAGVRHCARHTSMRIRISASAC